MFSLLHPFPVCFGLKEYGGWAGVLFVFEEPRAEFRGGAHAQPHWCFLLNLKRI